MQEIPTYKIKVNKDITSDGVYAISIVHDPAIEENFLALSKIIPLDLDFSTNKEKQELSGPFLVPNKKIYRKIGDQEFYILFDEDVIETIAEKYLKNNNIHTFNIEHSDKKVEGYLKESYILKEDMNGLPKGTWYGTVKIEDQKFWKEYVKGEKVKGFSVELKATELELINLNKTKNKHLIMSKKIKLEDLVSVIEEIKTEISPEATVSDVIAIIEEKASEIAEEIVDEVQEEVVSEEVQLAEEGTETSTVEDVVVEEGKSVEQQVMDLINPVIEKYDAQLETIMSKLNDLESKIVIESEPSEEVVELKKQVIELKSLISTTPATKSVDTKIQAKEDAMKQKLSFFQNIKK